MPRVILAMGPAGSGKSTLGAALALRLGVPFLDADDHCPAEARAKMVAGIPLQDADRHPWLDTLNCILRNHPAPRLVLACSAHKESYRQRLFAGLPPPCILYLHGSVELLHERMSGRTGHFMPVSLLPTQLALMERPSTCLVLDVKTPLVSMIESAVVYCAGTRGLRPA